jgi:hypothetical protein
MASCSRGNSLGKSSDAVPRNDLTSDLQENFVTIALRRHTFPGTVSRTRGGQT